MAVSVIPDLMTVFNDLLKNFRVNFRLFSDAEKSGFCVKFVECLQKFWREFRRSVIESQCHDFFSSNFSVQ